MDCLTPNKSFSIGFSWPQEIHFVLLIEMQGHYLQYSREIWPTLLWELMLTIFTNAKPSSNLLYVAHQAYIDKSACMAQQNIPTPECVVNDTECYDGWVWAVYLPIRLPPDIRIKSSPWQLQCNQTLEPACTSKLLCPPPTRQQTNSLTSSSCVWHCFCQALTELSYRIRPAMTQFGRKE